MPRNPSHREMKPGKQPVWMKKVKPDAEFAEDRAEEAVHRHAEATSEMLGQYNHFRTIKPQKDLLGAGCKSELRGRKRLSSRIRIFAPNMMELFQFDMTSEATNSGGSDGELGVSISSLSTWFFLFLVLVRMAGGVERRTTVALTRSNLYPFVWKSSMRGWAGTARREAGTTT